MNRKPLVALDVDGVLADFVGHANATAKRVLGRALTAHETGQWDVLSLLPPPERKLVVAEIVSEGWCASMPILEGASNGVAALRRVADVHFVTSPWHAPHWVYERSEWLRIHFAADVRRDVSHMNTKHHFDADFLVDDKIDHVVGWTQAKQFARAGCAVLWATPSNVDSQWTRRMASWDELADFVKRGFRESTYQASSR